MISCKDFQPITLADQDFFRDFFQKYPQVHSDNSFTNIVCWNHYADYTYAECNGSLIITSTIEGEHCLRGPIGPYDPELLDDVLRLAAKEGGEPAYYIFDEEIKNTLESKYPGIAITEDRDFFDYVYRTEELAALRGKAFLTIRKHLNRFRKKCNYVTEEVTTGTLGELEEFLIKWCKWRECQENRVLGEEKCATLFALKHFEELGLSGRLLRVNGSISAVAIYEELNSRTALVHFEKGLPDCQGIYKGINYETAQSVLGSYEYINRESDVGEPGLREAKMRYHPDHFAKVWYITKEELQTKF